MAKLIPFRTPTQQKEARLVAGMANRERRAEYELYTYCYDYFRSKFRGVFFAGEEIAEEIFRNSFIVLWKNIEEGKIYVQDDIVTDMNGEPFTSSILTYFMSIARNKYKEIARERPVYADPDTEMGRKVREEGFDAEDYKGMLYDPGDNLMLDIIADLISTMSPRCNEILTKFYYEEKKLEVILSEIPSIDSKDALKTKKYKCIENLRKSANEIYRRILNA